MKLDGMNTNKLNIDSGTGSIKYYGIVNTLAKIDSGTGTIELNLDQKEDDFSYNISGGVGSVNINGTKYSSDTKIKNNSATSSIEIDSVVGSVAINTNKYNNFTKLYQTY